MYVKYPKNYESIENLTSIRSNYSMQYIMPNRTECEEFSKGQSKNLRINRKSKSWQSKLYDTFSQRFTAQTKLSSSQIIKKEKNRSNHVACNKLKFAICKYCSRSLELKEYRVHNNKCKQIWRQSSFYKALKEVDF